MKWSLYDGLAILVVGSALFLVVVAMSWWKSVIVGEWDGGD